MAYGKLRKIATIAMVVACGSTLAEPVDADEAVAAVENWLKSGRAMGCTGMGDVSDVQAYDGREGVGKFYVISLKNGDGEAAGYVVTSADRKLNPVLAYSDDGTFGATDDNPLWTMLTIDVPAVTKELEANEAAQSAASSGRRLRVAALTENERKWAELLEDASAGGTGIRIRASASASITDVRVSPLLSTKWNQAKDDYYNNTWNLMTPSNYLCGCVATAAAQIMKYWAWPGASANITAKTDYTGKVVVGSVTNTWRLSDFTTGANEYRPAFGGTYQWSEMADEYRYNSSAESRLAVAKLVRDIGMSVHMTYEYDGSGAMNPIMAVRFTDQFVYANAMCRYPNENTNWDTERDNTIRANLNAGLPLGVSVPGHAIVADGYGYESETFYVHFNMGWGGSKNYWYNPPDLTAGNSAFNSIKCLIFNIYPPTKCAEAGRSVVSGRVLDSSGTPLVGVTVEVRKGTATFATTTSNDKGIYALLLPKAQYTFRAATDKVYATTNITVKACTSNRITTDETAFYHGGDSTGNICGADLVMDIPIEAVATPVFSPKSGTKFFKDGQPVSITCSTSDAEIRYTLDGTDPTSASALYTGNISISSSTTIKARAFKMDCPDSEIASATYVRSPIVGANLVQDTAPAAGTSQTVSLPVAGDYTVSFSYSGSGNGELQLIREGVTNVVATVAASGAGTFSTNLTWTAGDWELRMAGGASVSNLSMSIPATEDNLKRYWVYETPYTFGATGTWREAPATANGMLGESGDNMFTPTTSPAGRIVTYMAKVRLATGEELPDMPENTKAAVGLCYVGNTPTFALLTSSEGEMVWENVFAEGIASPQAGVEYDIMFSLDCSNRTYNASVAVNGTTNELAAADGKTVFAFAGDSTPLSGVVEFLELAEATMLTGSYYDIAGFSPGDVVAMKDSGAATLSPAQADWLNAMGDYDAVCAKLAEMTAEELDEAWLLNLDLTADSPALVSFSITGIDVTDSDVKVNVALVRTGVMEDAEIKGVLRLYGGENPGDIDLLTATPIVESDFGFGSGDSTTLTFPRSGSAKFFRAVISAP